MARLPHFELREDWKWVLRYTWSIRFMIGAGLLTAAETIVPIINGFEPIPGRLYAALMFVLTFSALVSRLVAQKIQGTE